MRALEEYLEASRDRLAHHGAVLRGLDQWALEAGVAVLEAEHGEAMYAPRC